jgi:hypothetical protein
VFDVDKQTDGVDSVQRVNNNLCSESYDSYLSSYNKHSYQLSIVYKREPKDDLTRFQMRSTEDMLLFLYN